MTTLQTVELGVLGTLQVRQYGLPVAIPGAKPRAILTMLGLHGDSVVSADTLVELLWGDDPPRTAAKALQTHISALRRTLGDGFVLTEGTGWTLRTTEIDATRYRAAVRLGRDAIAAGDVAQAVVRFDEALSLWRGTPELPDGSRGGSEKTRWIESHAALVEDRADALLATGRAAEIIGELEAAVADAPLRERRWGQLMLALYRAGRQGEALGAFQRARSLLAEELGVDPGPDLRRLEAAIVAQDSALEIPVSQQLSAVTRAVTFLLTDIEGSTAAWEADADAMAVALARHDEIAEQVVTSHGGRLVKTRGEGDATFSVFDRPSAAAAAAIALQEAIGHEPWALAEPMRIRVALHTGEVELRDGDYFGRAVNRAARLRSLAAGGQILCSGATAELVIDTLSDDVLLLDLGTRQLKNLARPEHVFELRLETADDPAAAATEAPPMERPDLPAVLAGPGPFVGRGRELEGLLTAWQTTLEAGAHAVLIAGEPGVGKTRLAGEWSRQAYEQGAVVLYGRCDEDLGAPYQPFSEALRLLAPCLGPDRLRGLRGVEALLPLVPGLTDVLPDLAGPARADPDTERYALFDAVVALLGVASASAPVVLILDDLHWAAKPTLLLLRHLLRFGEHARVQIVGTYRSTDLDRSHPLAAMLADLHRDGSAHRLQLGGLDEEDVTAYVAEAGYDDEELARALASVTGGNPFFLIEALRHVDESGGRWDPSTLPQGVREAVSRRLSRLPAETNKALAAAAVVGSRFAVDLVERVTEQDLIDAFDEACKAGIIIEEPGGLYRFNHALVRQSLLAELASVRRMRLHQRIAVTLENEPGADDELLSELAYHYFECAWAGNAAKAVDYCRRAADQAMARLAYEGAADLYDRALHALEELDEELPDRDDQQAELLVARCEALLAAGDVVSASGAVAQLREAARDSARLAAWGTCFDGEVSMLTHPERLDEIEDDVAAAAENLAGLGDAAGEAKAHTVRAVCLGRLGRIADCETALDQALTAARRAGEHRRVNAVLATAPLAALWGPNPVPRAGGRCLDVVRLLRITTGSPVVEATSTRCQGVLDAFRGRAAAGRQLIHSARRSLTELGMRHALLEVEQFAGLVELVADDPGAAEPHLRKAYNGFRRMGLDADTAETAAVLARACLALERDAEADELCAESERLAGHALKAAIAWRTVRAELSARRGADDEARRVAEEAVALAERTDALVDHGDACMALATVLAAAGNVAQARAAAEKALGLYEQKGAAALAEKARSLLGERELPVAPAPPEAQSVELVNACVRAGERVVNAVDRKAWDEVEQLWATDVVVESRRKIVGFRQKDLSSADWGHENRRVLEAGALRVQQVVVAVRGDRLALARLIVGTADESPGSPHDEYLQLYGIDEDGRIAMQVWFDIEDIDAAMAELDARYARFEEVHPRARQLENAASRADARVNALFAERRWDDTGTLFTDAVRIEDRRRGVRRESNDRAAMLAELRAIADVGVKYVTSDVVAIRGERLALVRTLYSGRDPRPDAFYTELIRVAEVDPDGRISAVVGFDLEDIDAAFEELDARYLAGEAAEYAQTWSFIAGAFAAVNKRELPEFTPDWVFLDHRRAIAVAPGDMPAYLRTTLDESDLRVHIEAVHRLSNLGAVFTQAAHGVSHQGFDAEWRVINLSTSDGDRFKRTEVFDEADLDAALARFDELSRPARGPQNTASHVAERYWTYFEERDWDALAEILADNFSTDDRRRMVGAGVRDGRDAEIADLRAIADLGLTNVTSTIIATRGERLLLGGVRFTGPDDQPETAVTEILGVIEIDANQRIIATAVFDPDDIDAAIAELDTRYLAGEAAGYTQTWSRIMGVYAALDRGGTLPPTTPDLVNIDHRRGVTFAPGDLSAYLHAAWVLTAGSVYVEAIHRLHNLGAVVTHVVRGTSREGFGAEWREVFLLTFDSDLISRAEVFDEADLEAALANFDQLSRPKPPLENAASRVYMRLQSCFTARDWGGMAEAMTVDAFQDDRRRVVNAEDRRGRDAAIAEARAVAELGARLAALTVVAIRGERLALVRIRFSGRDQRPEAFHIAALCVVEIDHDERVATHIMFDPDDTDVAFDELDARYAAGEAAPYAQTWSVIARAYAAANRHELPELTTDSVSIDHRRARAVAPGEMTAAIRATWGLIPDFSIHIEAVHRLSNLGAVFTHASRGTSQQGFEAEWREINLSTVDGELISRIEIFDETDLDAAIARFDELSRPAPLENAASQVYEQYWTCFATRDWDAMAEILADDLIADDRRRVVGAGVRRGRDAAIADYRAVADIGVRHATTTVLAIRGERLVLSRVLLAGRGSGAYQNELLTINEINADNRIAARVTFDPDDLDSVFAELDARYAAGEAAPYAQTWSAITGSFVAHNRREVAAVTPDVVSIDHRRVAAFAPGEGIDYIRAGWDLNQNVKVRIETVHCLSAVGAVFSWTGLGTSHEGFGAEWRGVELIAVEGGLISRAEVFDEEDLDAALARFDELSPPTQRLENAASRVAERVTAGYSARDWDAVRENLADDFSIDDRRRIVNAGIRHGRSAAIEDLQASAGLGVTNATPIVTAIRGERLVLTRARFSGRDEAFESEVLHIVEIDAAEKSAAVVVFDPDAVDAAFAELDARYLAGEAAPYARTWSVIVQGNAALNRREIAATTPDWVNIDHRRVTAFAPGDLTGYIRAGWDVDQPVSYIEAVHRLDGLGAVFTHVAHGSSSEGFEAEWRVINLSTLDGDLLSRCELFDEEALDVARARFDELHTQTQRLENAASRAMGDYLAHFATRDWDVMADAVANEFSSDDRRRDVVNSGVQSGRDAEITNLKAIAEIGCTDIVPIPIATRGQRLVLTSTSFSHPGWPQEFRNETIDVGEVNAENKLVAHVAFDRENLEAAIGELDARYLAGEAATHSHTWSVITHAFAALNRREVPATTPDWVRMDHRSLPTFTRGDWAEFLHATWSLTPDVVTYIESVHRLSELGAVVTHVARGTSHEGFDAEWRMVDIFTVEGDLISRGELFDESDIDAALARFDELSHPAPQLDNTATRVDDRYEAYVSAGDFDAMAETMAVDVSVDDRRRVVNAGLRRGRDFVIADVRLSIGAGLTRIAPTTIATRGERLALRRVRYWGRDQRPEAFQIDLLQVSEIDADGRIAAIVVVDPDDLDSAFQELDARYLVGAAAAHARTWAVIAASYAAFNRRELPATTPNWVNIDHRRVTTMAPGDLTAIIRATWDVAPDVNVHVEAVHRLSNLGAVVTQATNGTSHEGFGAEWREIALHTVDGDLINRIETFDESDLDAALARFDELSRPTSRLENAASQMEERFWTHFAARDWPATAAMLAEGISTDDRRRVVNAGLRQGRDAVMAEILALYDVGAKNVRSDVVATRGGRLVLNRVRLSAGDKSPEAFSAEVLVVVDLDTESRMLARVLFDLNDIDAAYEELDRRYLAGEAAQHASIWRLAMDTLAEFNRHEPGPLFRGTTFVDHRRLGFAPGDFGRAVQELWEMVPNARYRVTKVHALDAHAAAATVVVEGTDTHGVELQWGRTIVLSVVDGSLRQDIYEEDDIDGALARFDELSRPGPRLENAASRADDRVFAYWAARNWTALAETLAEDSFVDDRRHVVNIGRWDGRDVVTANLEALAEGGSNITSTVIATRGERCALIRICSSNSDLGRGDFAVEMLGVAEINADERIAAHVMFDPDDIEAAFAELEARYLGGEAAPYAQTWSVAVRAFAAINRHEFPEFTPDWVNIDHRQAIAFEAGEMTAYLHATLADAPDIRVYYESVHRLTNVGAVVTQVARNTSQQGFEAEWRVITLETIEGNLISRVELFDEEDLHTALARFDELNRPAPRLENAASQVAERFLAYFAVRDWDAMTESLADETFTDDRRPLLGLGVQRGRDAVLTDWRATADVGVSNVSHTVVATRGGRLSLIRLRFAGRDQRPDAFRTDVLGVIEIDSQRRIAACVMLDLDDLAVAFEDLDTRYAAGEAAAYAHTWSVITEGYAAINRRELPTTTPDCASFDHRRVTPWSPGELFANLRASFDMALDFGARVTAVHRLSDLGAVVTWLANGTAREGFEAEWRAVNVLTVDGDLLSRVEVYDEADLDVALARFDELSRPTARLENAASQVMERFWACFTARDWDAMGEILCDDMSNDDRRRVVNAGVRHGRDAAIGDMRANVDLGFTNATWTLIATRGERLALARIRHSGRDQGPEAFQVELLSVGEINTDDKVVAGVLFDLDDIDAAFAELDARYLAGEAAAYAQTWSAVAGGYAAANRQELPEWTLDFVNIDHRRARAFEPGDLAPYLDAMWEQLPVMTNYIEAVHRLSDHGVVITHVARGASHQGFEAEWRDITLLMVDGDQINRCEIFEEEDLDVALERFDELNLPAPRLENAASRVTERFWNLFTERDWGAMAEMLTADSSSEDRRRVVGSGVLRGREADIADLRTIASVGAQNFTPTFIATRGERLVLGRFRVTGPDQRSEEFYVEMLGVVEINADERIVGRVAFDPDDIDAAFDELDTRYLAGEAAVHAQTWSAIAKVYSAINRHEFPEFTPDWVNIDHRRGAAFAPGDLTAYAHAAWDDSHDTSVYVETVHRLNGVGAVVTYVACGTTADGFEAEWRELGLSTVEGLRVNRTELFDEKDLGAALARFDELSRPSTQLLNAATRANARIADAFNDRDLKSYLGACTADARYDDRRKGLRSEGPIDAQFGNALLFEAAESWRLEIEHVAVRGHHLALSRYAFRDAGEADRPIAVEALVLLNVNDDQLVTYTMIFDPDDIDGAIAELTAHWIASGEVAHPEVIEAHRRLAEISNQHDWDAVAAVNAGAIYINHRQLPTAGDTIADHMLSMRTMASLIPDFWVEAAQILNHSATGVLTSGALRGTSTEGLTIEIPLILLSLFDGAQLTRMEVFDPDQRAMALARFEELNRPT